LSREIVVFGLFSQLAAAFTLAAFVDFIPAGIVAALGVGVLVIGVLGIYTSIMIYHDTQRPFWAFPITALKFFGSAVYLASSGYLLGSTLQGDASMVALSLLVLAASAKLLVEFKMLGSARHLEMTPARKTAMLLLYPLRSIMLTRFSLSAVALIAAGILWVAPSAPWLAVLVCGAALSSELLERSLFFRAVAAPKMPGGVA
jgi:DMSO reductase anchor subunit